MRSRRTLFPVAALVLVACGGDLSIEQDPLASSTKPLLSSTERLTVMTTVPKHGSSIPSTCSDCLWGFADLHAHPATHLGFGAASNGTGGPFWGTPGLDPSGSTLPQDLPACHPDKHAGFDADAVRHNTRIEVLKQIDGLTGHPHTSLGWPHFTGWPHARSLTHQQMHVSWIRRAWKGGLRLMVASAMDNQMLSMLWHRGYGKSRPYPSGNHDYVIAVRQLSFIHTLVQANASWMQIVTTAAQARAAIKNNKLAVILGVEMDNLTVAQILALSKNLGVRVVTPVHLVDNNFGGTAIYEPAFNAANRFINHRFFDVIEDPTLHDRLNPVTQYLRYVDNNIFNGGDMLKWGAMEPTQIYLAGYQCNRLGCGGHRNKLGLRSRQRLRRLMIEGLMIDVAHMSQKTMEATVTLAEQLDYPLLNSHSGLRPVTNARNERSMLRDHARRIAKLGGVVGIGISNDTSTPIATWLAGYQDLRSEMGGTVALGTDFNGFSPMIGSSETPVSYPITFAAKQAKAPGGTPYLNKLMAGTRTFDFTTDGLANYGMLPDFIQAVSSTSGGTTAAHDLFRSADATVKMWDEVSAAKGRACAGTISEDLVVHSTDHTHGGSFTEQTYPMIVGGSCDPCFKRSKFTGWHTGHGACWTIGWISNDPTDCRVYVVLQNSGGFVNGTCHVRVYQH